MFFSPRIALKPLLGLCRRLSTALEAGIDVRTVLKREVERAHGPLRGHLLTVSQGISQGESLSDALTATGDYFPALFRELIAVGEQTGYIENVLAQLAGYYENQLTMRRAFWGAIAWPLVQLGIAIGIIGFQIWIAGVIPNMPDMLGLGLKGNHGLAIYVTFLVGVGAASWLVIRAVNRGLLWTRPIQHLVLRLPGIGKPLQTVALARLAWAMDVTMGSGMEVRLAIRLSLRSTQNAFYIDQIPTFDAEIAAGNSIHEAFCRAGGYPIDFLDTLAVGEQSGQVAESMGVLARQYQEQARAALAILMMLAGWAVWAAIATLLIVLIFRMYAALFSAGFGGGGLQP